MCSCPISKAFSSEWTAHVQIHTRNRAENFCQRIGIPTLAPKSTRGSLQNSTTRKRKRWDQGPGQRSKRGKPCTCCMPVSNHSGGWDRRIVNLKLSWSTDRQSLPSQRFQENKTKQQNFPIKSKEVLKDQVSLPLNYLAVRQRVKHAVCYPC